MLSVTKRRLEEFCVNWPVHDMKNWIEIEGISEI